MLSAEKNLAVGTTPQSTGTGSQAMKKKLQK